MKQLLDLDTFVKTLTDKGYNSYFQTEASYPGKLKESINEYLEASHNGTKKPNRHELFLLSTYLQWNGDDKPRIECNMWIRHKNGIFDVQKMDIERTDRYGQLLKKSELTNLSTGSVPTLKEAVAQVSEDPKQHISSQKRGFKM
ncbi:MULTISPECIES: hypothetical protein [Bacteroidota]|jgi:hypothetical protein|uniref:hypothetical protein n=1 Tax=Bacteroidota TaxID=976 RepID=UPI00088F7D60|nr:MULTISPECIES: hypothetical protein [Bacteroidota]OOB84259.1 hypothetical protein BZL53_04090 [Flavobacterium columnare]SDM47348.1 hypothetical protein SAMN04488084_10764 [Pedobacter antarcticus]